MGQGRSSERYFYGPNGETQIYAGQGQPVASSTVGNPFGYTGQVYDSEIGLYHYRARAYSPALGRFLQLDPAGFVDGMNRYQYAGRESARVCQIGVDARRRERRVVDALDVRP
jgi:RHS repeat-associated protein